MLHQLPLLWPTAPPTVGTLILPADTPVDDDLKEVGRPDTAGSQTLGRCLSVRPADQ